MHFSVPGYRLLLRSYLTAHLADSLGVSSGDVRVHRITCLPRTLDFDTPGWGFTNRSVPEPFVFCATPHTAEFQYEEEGDPSSASDADGTQVLSRFGVVARPPGGDVAPPPCSFAIDDSPMRLTRRQRSDGESALQPLRPDTLADVAAALSKMASLLERQLMNSGGRASSVSAASDGHAATDAPTSLPAASVLYDRARWLAAELNASSVVSLENQIAACARQLETLQDHEKSLDALDVNPSASRGRRTTTAVKPAAGDAALVEWESLNRDLAEERAKCGKLRSLLTDTQTAIASLTLKLGSPALSVDPVELHLERRDLLRRKTALQLEIDQCDMAIDTAGSDGEVKLAAMQRRLAAVRRALERERARRAQANNSNSPP